MAADASRFRRTLAALAAFCGLLAVPAASATVPETRTVLVYTPLHEITLANLARVYFTSTGQSVEFVRMPASEIPERLAAERGRPKADVVLGPTAILQEVLKTRGLTARYLSPLCREVVPAYRDPDGFWTGTSVQVQGIVVNIERFRKEFPGSRLPKTYDELLDPRYRGQIVAPNPTTSIAGFTFLISQLSRLGEERGWEYLAALDRNVRVYPTGSSIPANAVAAGEFTIGIAYAHDAALVRADGRPIRFIYPPRTGWDLQTVSLVKGAPSADAAQRFIDWLLTWRAQDLMTKISLTYPARADVGIPRGMTALRDLDLLTYDLKIVSAHRGRVQAEWARRIGNSAAGR
jgi:iron(III) transport system substrate-binding protein